MSRCKVYSQVWILVAGGMSISVHGCFLIGIETLGSFWVWLNQTVGERVVNGGLRGGR